MFDTGSTSFMLICTMLVLLMTPGVAFFYGGLARRKNVVNTMFMSMAIIGVVGVLWIIAAGASRMAEMAPTPSSEGSTNSDVLRSCRICS